MLRLAVTLAIFGVLKALVAAFKLASEGTFVPPLVVAARAVSAMKSRLERISSLHITFPFESLATSLTVKWLVDCVANWGRVYRLCRLKESSGSCVEISSGL